MPTPPTRLQLADCSVDLRRRIVVRDNHEQKLTAREVDLLAYLAARPGTVVSRDELLSNVWGYAPGVVSRAVDKTMARLRAKVEATPASPVHLISTPSVGYHFEPWHSTPKQHSLVGRGTELAAAASLLDNTSVLVIGGPGGIGKSRFTRVLARSCPRAWFCALDPVTDAEGVVAAIRTALALPPTAPLERAVAHLDGLLVLDNAEHVAAAVCEVVSKWVETTRLQVVITSREQLPIPGAQWFPLAPLQPEDAVQLFMQRAQQVDPSLTFDAADRDALGAVIQFLDGLPLAVELAAARMDICSLEDLATRLRGYAGLDLLSGGQGRHATLRHTIQDSWDLLDAAQQTTLAHSTVFRGGFTLQTAEMVIVPGDGTPVLDLLRALQMRSLLTVSRPEGPRGPARFGLHRAVRLFAAERCTDPAVERRHAEAMLTYGQALVDAIHRPGGPRALSRLALERDNLLAATEVPGFLVPVAAVLQPVFKTRGPLSTWMHICEQAVAGAEDPTAQGRALAHRGYAALMSGALEPATRDFTRALAVAREADDSEGAAMAAVRLAFLYDLTGRADEAGALLESVLPETGRMRAVVLGDLGIHHWRGGRWETAERCFQQSLALLYTLGDELQRPVTCLNRAHNLRILGRTTEAADMLRECVDLSEQAGFHRTEAVARLGLADLEPTQASQHLDRAATLGTHLDSAELVAVTHARRATEHHLNGDLDAARHGYQQAAQALSTLRTQAAEGTWLLPLLQALALQEAGDTTGAQAALDTMVFPADDALREHVEQAAQQVRNFRRVRSTMGLQSALEQPFSGAPAWRRFVRVFDGALRRR